MATTNDLRNGMVLVLDGDLWQVEEFLHVKPGKGPAFVRTKIRNVMTGKAVDKTFNAGLKVEVAHIDRRPMTYLYNDGEDYYFMDERTYDQLPVRKETIGDVANYLTDNETVQVSFHDDNIIGIELPTTVNLLITHTEPGLQGDRSSAGTKPATVETGYELQVPLYMNEDTVIKVDTRTGEYAGRAND